MRKRNQGSALLITLVVILILSVMLLGFLQLNFFDIRFNLHFGNYIQAKWACYGTWNLFLKDIKNNNIELQYAKQKNIINGAECELEFIPENNYYCVINIHSKKGNSQFRLQKKIKCLPFSYYTIFYNDVLHITSAEQKFFLPGPIYSTKQINIFLNPNQEMDLYAEEDITPLLSSQEKTEFFPQINSLMKIGVFRNNVWDRFKIFTEKEKGVPSNEIEDRVKKIDLPNLRLLYQNKLDRILPRNHIQSYRNQDTFLIVNDLLLEKEFIGMGNGYSHEFNLPSENRHTKNIYFYQSQNPNEVLKINPLKYADTWGINPQFQIKEKKIIIDPDKKQELDILKFKMEKLNRFVFADENYSYASLDRNIKDVYRDDKQMIEGNELEVNRTKREIYFYNPDFTGTLGTGNGIQREYNLPEKYSHPLFVFLNYERTENYIIKDNKIIFNTPVAYGKKIYYYKYIPKIYFSKDIPGSQVGVWIDKEIKLVVIDLDKIDYPTEGILLSNLPVLIKGNAKKPISIMSTNDIYLGPINPRGGACVSIMGRVVWIDGAQGKEIRLDDVYIYTEADQIYLLNGDKSKKIIFKGSATFANAYKNLIRPLEIEKLTKEYYLITKQNFFDLQFEYSYNIRHSPGCFIPLSYFEEE